MRRSRPSLWEACHGPGEQHVAGRCGESLVAGQGYDHGCRDAARVEGALVRALNAACTGVDAVAYRPVVVRLTQRLPSWWGCQVAHASMKLDERWHTGFWPSGAAPAAPDGPCDACQRRAGWLVVGGDHEETDSTDDYLASHPVQLRGWCELDFQSPPRNRSELQRALDAARARSVSLALALKGLRRVAAPFSPGGRLWLGGRLVAEALARGLA